MRLLLAVLLSASAFADDGGAPAADDGGPPPPGCHEAIGDENAQKLFAALKDFKADDCALEEMKTENDVMRIEWRKAGVPIPLLEVRPLACGKGTVNGPAFSLTIPPGAAEKCPAAIQKMSALIATESFGGPVKIDSASRDWIWIVGGSAALIAIVAFLVWKRREA
jgi:hypothetical protein